MTPSLTASDPDFLGPKSTRTFLGHPIGLFFLFFTEMWERFSYYGMRSLLVLYMVNFLFLKPDVGREVLGFNALRGGLEHMFGPLGIQPLSSQIYGLYTAFVYLTPFFGGLLADKILGQKKAVILGAVLMAIGHFLMAVQSMFFPALIFLILGNGAFKPNISTQVGGLYPKGDSRRDRAFTIFYMGINLGAFGSPLICGTLGQTVGWHWGFGAAGVGMVLGLVPLSLRPALPGPGAIHDQVKSSEVDRIHQPLHRRHRGRNPGAPDRAPHAPVLRARAWFASLSSWAPWGSWSS